MKRIKLEWWRIIVFILLIIGITSPTFAGQKEFCSGFTEGYKSVKGKMTIVPICPTKPFTPLGSTDFREGFKEGIKAAIK